MLWSTVSKAADKSSSTSADRSPASIASNISDRTFRMAVLEPDGCCMRLACCETENCFFLRQKPCQTEIAVFF